MMMGRPPKKQSKPGANADPDTGRDASDDDDVDDFASTSEPISQEEAIRRGGLDDESVSLNRLVRKVRRAKVRGEKGVHWPHDGPGHYEDVLRTYLGQALKTTIERWAPEKARIKYGYVDSAQYDTEEKLMAHIRETDWDGEAREYKWTVSVKGAEYRGMGHFQFSEDEVHRQRWRLKQAAALEAVNRSAESSAIIRQAAASGDMAANKLPGGKEAASEVSSEMMSQFERLSQQLLTRMDQVENVVSSTQPAAEDYEEPLEEQKEPEMTQKKPNGEQPQPGYSASATQPQWWPPQPPPGYLPQGYQPQPPPGYPPQGYQAQPPPGFPPEQAAAPQMPMKSPQPWGSEPPPGFPPQGYHQQLPPGYPPQNYPPQGYQQQFAPPPPASAPQQVPYALAQDMARMMSELDVMRRSLVGAGQPQHAPVPQAAPVAPVQPMRGFSQTIREVGDAIHGMRAITDALSPKGDAAAGAMVPAAAAYVDDSPIGLFDAGALKLAYDRRDGKFLDWVTQTTVNAGNIKDMIKDVVGEVGKVVREAKAAQPGQLGAHEQAPMNSTERQQVEQLAEAWRSRNQALIEEAASRDAQANQLKQQLDSALEELRDRQQAEQMRKETARAKERYEMDEPYISPAVPSLRAETINAIGSVFR